MSSVATSDELFAGPGDIRARYRAMDWSQTPLGPVESWPAALRTVVRTTLESPFAINLWCGPHLALIYNDAYSEVLGAKHPEAMGKPGAEVWSEIWPDIEPLFEQIRAGGPAVFADDAPFHMRRHTGSDPATEANAWFTFSLSPVRDENDDIVAFLNIVSETTPRILAERALHAALRQAELAEARLREVFAQAPAFLAVLRGEDHVFEYVNKAYYELVGNRELIGKPLFDALPDVRGQGFEKLLGSVLATGEPFIGREVPVTVMRDGEQQQIFIDLVYYPITDEGGDRTGVVAHGSDVTAHVLARREAQSLRIRAEDASRAKSYFLANMSHEIRTPINAVIGYADLLDARIGGELSGRQQDYVTRIRTSSRHLLGLGNDVLDLSKIEAGEMTIQKVSLPVGPPVTHAADMIAPEASAKNLTLTCDWRCDQATSVVGDEDRVRQIVLNLLSNAVKFTEAGGEVRVRVTTDEPGLLAVAVTDTGIGIAAENLEAIFQPFVQAELGHTRRAGGTGLGLTISRRFAEMMGGELRVESELGAGSTFTLVLRRG